MSDFVHDPLPMVIHAFKHPPRPCPVKNFPMALRDMRVDDIVMYDVAISVADLSRLSVNEMQKVSDWLLKVMLPHMSQYGKITISKFDGELNNTEGDASFG